MAIHDSLGDRMKEYYENIPKTKLMRRTPVVIRLDGRSFHTFTRGFEKPFDEIFIASMQDTMKYLCENISGCVLGYCQSDEITLILVDYQTLETSAWFDYEVEKLCSISASMATLAFNRTFKEKIIEKSRADDNTFKNKFINDIYWKSYNRGATFDSRCFNIPKEEVTNLIYWRQLDAVRNSIQMVGQANFSHKELQNKTCDMIKEMLIQEKGINWDDLLSYQKWGSCCIKKQKQIDYKTFRMCWEIDKNIPLFKGEKRDYIDKLVYI